MASSLQFSPPESAPSKESRQGLVAAGTTPLHRLDGDCWVEIVTVDDANMAHAADWDDLAANACDPNVFFERWFLVPAMQAFRTEHQVAIACVYRGSSRKDVAPALVGLFPIELSAASRFSARTLRLFRHEYSFLLTPLLRQGHAVEAWAAFFAWADERSGCDLIDLPLIRAEGAVARALAEVVYRRTAPSLVSAVHARALLRRSTSAEECLGASLTTKQRHEYQRQSRRLSELGPIEYRQMSPGDSAIPWIEWFIDLESRGWKGQARTALADAPVAREFFTNVLIELARRGRLQAIGIWQNDRPIALKLNFIASPGSFAFKIAYDESFSKFSPGVLLELENIRVFHAATDAAWMDSCASPEHPMINRIWRDRLLLQQLLLSTGTRKGDLAVGLRPLGRVLRRVFRKQTRTAPAKATAAPRSST